MIEENRLTSVSDSGLEIFKATYDYRTRRTTKTESSNSGTDSTTAYVYIGGVCCQN